MLTGKYGKIFISQRLPSQKKKQQEQKKHLYKKAKKSNSEDHWVAYRTLNNTLEMKCNSAKWSNLKALADKLQVENNSKPFWNYMGSIRKGVLTT